MSDIKWEIGYVTKDFVQVKGTKNYNEEYADDWEPFAVDEKYIWLKRQKPPEPS